MNSPQATVQAFIAQWRISPEAFYQSFRDYFTDTTVWANVGMSETTGIDDAIALMEQFEQKLGRFIFDVKILSIMAQGDVVLTERIDYVRSPDGKLLLTVPIMGAFEIREGKVVAWRDYFDTMALAAYGTDPA